jgi:hypothetical protein
LAQPKSDAFDITTRRGEFPGAALLSRFAPP